MTYSVPLTLAIVLRYLSGRVGFTRVVTAFSVLGISLGVAALIVVMTVMNGFRDELLTRILGLSGHATVNIPALTLTEGNDLATILATHPFIDKATPFVTGQGMALSRRGSAGGFVRGVQKADIPEIIQKNIKTGSLEALSALNTVALGGRLAHKLGVTTGDRITLVSPDGAQTIVGFIPRMVPLKVVATFSVGMYQFDEGLMLTNLKTAQRFYRLRNGISGVEVRTSRPEIIQKIREDMYEKIDGPAQITTWQESNRDFFQALEVERVSMFIILSLIVVVAAFNIITGQMMLVGDKRADIGILRTLGATQARIQRIFLLNGMALGALGTLGGFALGLLLVWKMQAIIRGIEFLTGAQIFSGKAYFLDAIPQSLVWSDVGVILGIAFVLTLLASYFPARRAAQLNVVEVLRDA